MATASPPRMPRSSARLGAAGYLSVSSWAYAADCSGSRWHCCRRYSSTRRSVFARSISLLPKSDAACLRNASSRADASRKLVFASRMLAPQKRIAWRASAHMVNERFPGGGKGEAGAVECSESAPLAGCWRCGRGTGADRRDSPGCDDDRTDLQYGWPEKDRPRDGPP